VTGRDTVPPEPPQPLGRFPNWNVTAWIYQHGIAVTPRTRQ
jgi:hypothetical protein